MYMYIYIYIYVHVCMYKNKYIYMKGNGIDKVLYIINKRHTIIKPLLFRLTHLPLTE